MPKTKGDEDAGRCGNERAQTETERKYTY